MFETIERQTASSGGSGPQWLSSHPNPGNRTEYITKEAALLTLAAAPDTSGFAAVKPMLASLPPAKSTADLARANAAAPGGEPGETLTSVGTPGEPLSPPAGRYRDISGGRVFQASVPSEWTTMASKTAIKVVPQNGYGQLNGQTVFTCGIEFGVTKAASRDLQEATDAWLKAVAENNPELRLAGTQQAIRMSQRSALATPLINPSPLGGREQIAVYTTFLADGSLFYYLTLVPEKDAAAFQEGFRRVGQSIRLTEVR
jgi:hypothetical protein